MYVPDYYTHWLQYFYEKDLTKVQRQKYDRGVEVGNFRDYVTKKISYLKQMQRKRKKSKITKRDTIFLSEDENDYDKDKNQTGNSQKDQLSDEDDPLACGDFEKEKDEENAKPRLSGVVLLNHEALGHGADSSDDMFAEDLLESSSEDETE